MMNYRYWRNAVGDVFGWAFPEAIAGASTRLVLTLVVKIKRLVPAPTQGGFDLKWFLQTKSGGRWPPETEP
jgi:hypothetical protein